MAVASAHPTEGPVRAGPQLVLEPCPFADALRLERDLGVPHAVAQVLVRRGLSDPGAAQAWLAAAEEHPPGAFAGMAAAVEVVARHVRAGSRITVHGDYDVDGVCSTALLVGALRDLGATVDWHLPSRFDEGYGLSLSTVERLRGRGTRLLVTVDCGVTAVTEVAAARAAGMDILVTDHHSPRTDGALPEAPLLHPVLGGYPCADLCATAVAHKLAVALREHASVSTPSETDLDLVALATVADVVPLRGENRRLVRAGLRSLAASTRPGVRALLDVVGVDPSAVNERAVAFALAPRVNAAGRVGRADAGVELFLTDDPARAEEIARELDAANRERRDTETRTLFEAEAQVAAAGDAPAYVVAGEGWNQGVVGLVASRLAERHHRPAVVIALDGERGVGSGRSIPGFDLLAGLEAAAEHLLRHGGHRAAAGLELAAERLADFRAAFVDHAGRVLRPEDMVPTERVDAVVSGEEIGAALAQELEALAPFGAGNPPVTLLVPAARLRASTPMGEGRHVRFTVESGSVRSRGVGFGTGGRVPVALDAPADATFTLELSEYAGLVEPRLVLRHARTCVPAAVDVLGEPAEYLAAVWEELERELEPWPPCGDETAGREIRDRRGLGVAGTLAGLVATGEGVLVVCADSPRRERVLAERVGGFALCSYAALERLPEMAQAFVHVVALDPPAHAHLEELLRCGRGFTHLAWGPAELRFAQQVHELEYGLRASLPAFYRCLRAAGGAEGERIEAMLRGDGPHPRSPALAGRLLRVLGELGLVQVDRDRLALEVPAAKRTTLERSAAFRAYQRRHEDGIRFLTKATAQAA
jgi:single-stranded-DNA-specific exonuclease